MTAYLVTTLAMWGLGVLMLLRRLGRGVYPVASADGPSADAFNLLLHIFFTGWCLWLLVRP